MQNYCFFVNPTIAFFTKKCTIIKHHSKECCKIEFAKCTFFKNARKKEGANLEDRILFSDDGSDEVVYAGIDEIVAVFIFGRDRVMRSVELGIEAVNRLHREYKKQKKREPNVSRTKQSSILARFLL